MFGAFEREDDLHAVIHLMVAGRFRFLEKERKPPGKITLLSFETSGGNLVPFFMQESLGGSHTLRGFDSFRFRGEKVELFQIEYRWEPMSFWELAVFTDGGTAAQSGESLSDLHWDYGVGMRFKTYRDVLLRFEIAFSNETTRYYIRSSTSF